jgi:recombination protein RecA
VKVVKNKVAPPFRQSEFDIIYGTGISWAGSVLDVALEDDIIEKSGSYFSFEKERLGQGRANVRAFLDEHPDVLERITRRIEEKQGITISGGSTAPAHLTPIPTPDADEAPAAAPAEDAVAAE